MKDLQFFLKIPYTEIVDAKNLFLKGGEHYGRQKESREEGSEKSREEGCKEVEEKVVLPSRKK